MTSTNDYLKNLLLCDESENWETSDVGAFFVHESIFDQIKILPDIKIQHAWDYELQISENSYDMKLLYVKTDVVGSFAAMWKLCRCDFTFPWEQDLTLYVPVRLFKFLEMFIDAEDLHQYVKKIEDRNGIVENYEMIRIVHFRKNIGKKTKYVDKFKTFAAQTMYSLNYPRSFYCTIAFPWLQPWALNHFDNPLVAGNKTFLVFQILLENTTHLSVSLFDLVVIRMAFCDFRNLQPTMFLQSILDNAIVRLLKTPKYNNNNGFDIDKYIFDENISVNIEIELVRSYLVYEFESYFKCRLDGGINMDRYSHTIELHTNSDPLKTLHMQSNFKFKIDGQKFDGMSLKLFYNLVGCHNVIEIILDTNYQLIEDWTNTNEFTNFARKKTYLFFLGNNNHKFIEKLMQHLKSYPILHFGYFVLDIDCELVSYSIFDGLRITELVLRNIMITKSVMIDISKFTTAISRVTFFNCKFDYECENWMMLTNLQHLTNITFQEQEITWESIFDFVAHMLDTSNATEYRFEQEIIINCTHGKTFHLHGFKFILNEDGTKIELQEFNGASAILDLYLIKFGIESDDECNYDFYQ